MIQNYEVIKMTKEIITAMLSNCDHQVTEKSGDEIAKCMDAIYKELTKLFQENPTVIKTNVNN